MLGDIFKFLKNLSNATIRFYIPFVLVLATFSLKAQGAQVVVLGNEKNLLEIGQGFLVTYAGQCRLIMPTHVATESALNIRREGPKPIFGAIAEGRELGDDVSVFSLRGLKPSECGVSSSVLPRLVDRLLLEASNTAIRYVNADGSVGVMPVSVVDNDGVTLLRVKPQLANDRISKGMSGSSLLADGKLVGMLVSVNARSGVGTVVRQDVVLKKIDDALKASLPTKHADGASVWSSVQNLSYELSAWSAVPLDGQAPDRLMHVEQGRLPLRFQYAGQPVAFEIALDPKKNIISGFKIDVHDVPKNELPDVVEVLISQSRDSSSWISVRTAQLQYVNDVATVPIVPKRASKIQLRFSLAAASDKNHGKPAIGLNAIKLILEERH